ncbi:MAG: magnesium transporter [Alphaproteobacteria bacterium]|nr:magnesium transporter [Alphaproteobacteria bacterium]
MTDQDQDIEHDAPLPEDAPLVHLPDSDIDQITAAVQAQDSDTVHAVLKDLSPPDAAELIAKVDDITRRELLTLYGDSIDPQVFAEMDYELRRIALSALSAAQVATLVSRLESDDALDMIIMLDEDFRKDIIRKLSAKMRLALEEGLSFPEESAGRLMQREFVAIPQFWTVGKTLDYLREAADDLPGEFFDIFVITPTYNIAGHIPLSRLVSARRSTKIETLSHEQTHIIPAAMDQEEVALIFRRDNITSAPVVDENNRLIGVITIDDVIDVIDEEAQEDLLRMAGVDSGDLYRAALSTSEIRFRWLFINLLTAFLAAGVVAMFSTTIDRIVALAVLMPIVAGMGGNAGTQTLAVVVRALATRELSRSNAWRIIWKETIVGLLNGVAFAIITGFAAGFWFHDAMLGTVIGLAMIVNLVVAGFFGVCIPIILNRYGSDPAVSSTVFLTTVTDVVGFFAFLGLAALMLL